METTVNSKGDISYLYVKLMDSLECESYLKKDVWIFMECDVLKRNMKNNERIITKSKNRSFDFTIIQNDNIRDEVKFFFAKQLMQDKMCPEINYLYSEFKRIFQYLSNEKFSHAQSLLDYDKEELVSGFRNTLERNQQSTMAIAKRINKHIKEDIYFVDSEVLRSLKKIYDYLYREIIENKNKYFERDKWVFSVMPFKVNLEDFSANKSISFTKIAQPGIKKMIKKLCWHELKMKAVGTAIVRVYSLTTFSRYLTKKFPFVNNIEDITYDMLHNYIAYLKTETGAKPKTIKGRVEAVHKLFETIRFMKWAKIDPNVRIKSNDIVKVIDKTGEPYTEEELREINRHLDQIPIQIARLLCVLQYTGSRISEICSFKIENLRKSEDGRDYLTYKQFKTNKYNVIPVEGIVLELLTAAIKTSCEYHGDNAIYIFSLENNKIIKPNVIDQNLKRLSYKCKLKDKSGKPLNIRVHRFRDTVATNYAELGIDPIAISRLLGQKSVGVLKHYVEIHNDIYLDAMQPLLEKQSQMIKNIGHIEDVPKAKIEDTVAIPLPNGSCYKPASSGLCQHANCCYNCKMFQPDSRYIHVYKNHLLRARQDLDIAKLNGYERILQINQDLEKSLIRIIEKVEEEEVS
ncbi:site-specific recombinase XerD [Paenibacillus taihuensis]|uniref:Site-specific recombinase XerD n=1 Tax=Paenibacillus taihuensis TaxID=1156355 RepID=A0A3D9RX70_9BACL|nr:site-specific integrase [Paenibacillus taihuensis]REE84573.1 site-specific recombinase XerD [Paenibacillus taihuensis]